MPVKTDSSYPLHPSSTPGEHTVTLATEVVTLPYGTMLPSFAAMLLVPLILLLLLFMLGFVVKRLGPEYIVACCGSSRVVSLHRGGGLFDGALWRWSIVEIRSWEDWVHGGNES